MVSGFFLGGDTVTEREVGAVSANYLDFIRYDVLSGRSITKEEVQSAAKVCMLEESFPEQYKLSVTVGEKITLDTPRMSIGQRKRETILAVIPESEQTAIAFALMSIAIPQVACEIASTGFLIIKSEP